VKNLIKYIKKRPFLIYILLVSLIKIVLAGHLPILILPFSEIDDKLMVNTAASLLSLDWLGPYSEVTLVKGFFFRLFLAVSKVLTIPYTVSVTIFYLIGCVIFTQGVKNIFSNKIYLAILFTVLAFNPITLNFHTIQRVYRSCMAPAQILIILGCLFGAYLRRDQSIRKLLPWLIVGGLALASMWLTREDGIWILPLTIGVIAVTCGTFIYRYVKKKEKIYLLKTGLSILPIAILQICLLLVSMINYLYYGVFTTNELNNSYFASTMKSIYSVQPSEDIDFVSVPRSKVNKLYEISPSLMDIHDVLESNLNAWEANGKKPGDGEVEDGWFFWTFRNSVAIAGYYSDARTANEYYRNVHNEIEQAFQDGLLERRATMPSALMSPWKEQYGKKILPSVIDALNMIINYDNISAQLVINDSVVLPTSQQFEFITGNVALYDFSSEPMKSGLQRIIDVDNWIIQGYQKTAIPLIIAGLASYLLITIMMFIRLRSKNGIVDVWLMATAVLLSLLVLAFGIAYTHISAYHAIDPLYMSAAYPMISVFIAITVLYIVQYFISIYKKGKKDDGQATAVKV